MPTLLACTHKSKYPPLISPWQGRKLEILFPPLCKGRAREGYLIKYENFFSCVYTLALKGEKI
jgi:hypothetical protein